MSRPSLLLASCASLVLLAPNAHGSAWLLPEGSGQLITTFVASSSDRTFDNAGRALPTSSFRKTSLSGYLEYGFSPLLTLVAAPTISRANSVSANTVTGSDSSAFGARAKLYESLGRILSIQALVQPPLDPGSRATQIATGGARDLAVDVRLQGGQVLTLLGMPSFVELAPGVRARPDPFPSEARVDATLGVRPTARLLLLAQGFISIAPANDAVARQSYEKVQISAVYDLTPRLALQVGGFRTVAGRNALREGGPFGGVWFRW